MIASCKRASIFIYVRCCELSSENKENHEKHLHQSGCTEEGACTFLIFNFGYFKNKQTAFNVTAGAVIHLQKRKHIDVSHKSFVVMYIAFVT